MLKEGGRGAGSGSPRDRMRTGLLVAEVALALVLLVGAGLLIRSAAHLQEVELGFDPSGVLTGQLALPRARVPPPGGPCRRRSYSGCSADVGASPASSRGGVDPAAAARDNVSSSGLASRSVRCRRREERSIGTIAAGDARLLPDRCDPALRGRDFTAADRAGAPDVAMVNQSWRARVWPGEDAARQAARLLATTRRRPVWMEVVGVAATSGTGSSADEDERRGLRRRCSRRTALLGDTGLDGPGGARGRRSGVDLQAGAPGGPAESTPGLPVFDLRTMEEISRLPRGDHPLQHAVLLGLWG